MNNSSFFGAIGIVKDDNAHFTYNIGVGIKRLAILCLVICVILRLIFIAQPGNGVTYQGKTEARLVEAFSRTYRSSGKHRRTVTEYYISFEVPVKDGEPEVKTQKVGKRMYEQYRSKQTERTESYNTYLSETGHTFLTQSEDKEAAKEYQAEHSTFTLDIVYYLGLISFIGSVFLWLAGRKQQKIAEKYPRTDGYDLIVKDRTLYERAAKEAEIERQFAEYEKKRHMYGSELKPKDHKPTDVELNRKFK